MTDKYVSYKTARLLKQAGFNETCRAFWKTWDGRTDLYNCDRGQAFDYTCNKMLDMAYNDSSEENIAAPTPELVKDWLKKHFNLFVEITLNAEDGVHPMYDAWIVSLATCERTRVIGYDEYSYDEALEKALQTAIEKTLGITRESEYII